jgi:hypothetical protein
MQTALGIVVLVIGVALAFSGPRLARFRISLHFSTEDLRATSGPRYRRVRMTTIGAYVVNAAMAAFWIYLGIRFLTT